ncbi:MAG: hypothetical protein IKT42_00060 [Clostridia bacterium]|nr:hypothetical protein [Clostridia bacterium]
MKNYNETINTVFERIGDYKLKRLRKKKIIMRVAIPALSMCLAVAVGIFAFKGDIFKSNPLETLEDSTVIGEKDYIEPEGIEGNWYGEGQETPPENSGNNTSNSEDTVGKGSNGIVGDNDTADVLGTVVVDGIQYMQMFVDAELFTADKYLGDAREFDGTYKSHINDITAELYTVKESNNVLVVKLGNGGTVVLGRVGNIVVNGKLYGIVGINPTEHVVGEFLGTADEFEIIDVPYREKRINLKDEIWSMKDYNDGLFIKTTDGKWVVLYYYPLYGLME